MATSSITKEFVIKDEKAYCALKKCVDSRPMRVKPSAEPSCLLRGREKLARFSFR